MVYKVFRCTTKWKCYLLDLSKQRSLFKIVQYQATLQFPTLKKYDEILWQLLVDKPNKLKKSLQSQTKNDSELANLLSFKISEAKAEKGNLSVTANLSDIVKYLPNWHGLKKRIWFNKPACQDSQ